MLIERKNNILNNKSGSKESILENLNKQKKDLEKQLGGVNQTLVAPRSGIFVSQADGFEQTLTFDSINTLTPSEVNEYLSREEYKPSDEIYPYPVCKITDNSEWILAAVCSEEIAAQTSVGKPVKVSFPDEGEKTLRCTIYEISEPVDGEVVIYIMGTKEIYNVLTARKMKINIVFESYEGLRIPASAVKTIEGIDVVMVEKAGGDVETEVVVLFKDEDFAIIKEGGELSVYDKVRVD